MLDNTPYIKRYIEWLELYWSESEDQYLKDYINAIINESNKILNTKEEMSNITQYIQKESLSTIDKDILSKINYIKDRILDFSKK